MPRYRHKVNGVVVELSAGHAVHLGSEWEELGVDKPKPAPAPRRRKAKSDDDE